MLVSLRQWLLSLIIAFSFVLPAVAQDLPGSTNKTPPMPKILSQQTERGAQVRYLGRFETLDGWLVVRGGQPEFYYSTLDGKALVMGILFDAVNDKMLTNEQLTRLQMGNTGDMATLTRMVLENHGERDAAANENAAAQRDAAATPATPAPDAAAAPATGTTPAPAQTAPVAEPETATPPAPQSTPDASALAPNPDSANITEQGGLPNTPANTLYLDMMGANSVKIGTGTGPALYAFIDPNCPHCQHFIKDLRDNGFLGANGLSVHAVLVAFDQKSLRQAAYLLAAPNPGELLLRYIDGDAEALPAPETITTTGIAKNTQMMVKWGFEGTPVIVYRNAEKQIKIVRGRPLELKKLVQDLGGQ